jgi:uncharacterized protein YqeY
MTIVEKIEQDMKEALKAGDKLKVTVLRGLKSDIKYKQIAVGDTLSDEQCTEVLSSNAKKRRESIDQFRKAGRDDLTRKEQAELDIISNYLPKQLSEDQIKQLITEAIAEAGAESPKDMGDVMKILMPKIKGQADGKLVNRMVSEALSK